MKRLSLLSTITKLNKFGISPIYQYGLNSTTLRNIITIQQRSYTSISSTPPSSPPSSSSSSSSSSPPSASPSASASASSASASPSAPAPASPSSSQFPTITSTFEEKYSYLLKPKSSKAISPQEMKKKKLIVNEIIQSDKLLDMQLTSTLLLQLTDYDISLALKLFDKYHNDLIRHIGNKKEMINQEGKEKDEEIIEYFNKSQLQPLEIMLEYYVRKQDIGGLEAFCVKYISAYKSYFLSKPFFEMVKNFWKTEFEKFTEFVFRLYDIKSFASPKSSIFAMTSLLAVQNDSNESFNRFFNYHIERWGPITSEDASNIFEYLIATNDFKTIANVLNCTNSSRLDTTKFKPYVIVNLFKFRDFSESEQNNPIFARYQNLIFKQMKKLDTKEITGIIFFYNLLIDSPHCQGRFEINKQLLSRLRNEFLRTLPKETIKVIIDDLVKYFLSINQYEKSIYWFNANPTILANEISKASIFSFIAYHNLQLDKINIEIKNLTTTTTEIIGEKENEKENEKKKLEIEEYLTNKKKIEEYRQFWRKTLKLSENQTFYDEYLGMVKSVYSELKNINPSEILESIYHLPEIYEEILARKVDYQQQLKLNKDYHHNITLSAMLKNDNFKGSEIFNYLNFNFLNKSQLPVGTLLLDTILKIQSLDERGTQKEDKEQVDEKDEKVYKKKDNKESYISDYWENNDSGFSRLTNKEIRFIQPMLEGIKNDLILDRVEFDERYVQMLSIAQQLSLLPELGKDEIQILRVILLNLYFYKAEKSMVDYLKIVIEMIKNHHTIPFDVFEQTCWLVLENSQYCSKLPINYSNENITMLVDFIKKFTKENPTFEVGYLVILNSFYSLKKYNKVLSYIELNTNFRNTRDTLLLRTKCTLQINRKTTNWKEYLDRIESLKKFENLVFLLNPITQHLNDHRRELDIFRYTVLTKPPYSTYLINIDRAFERLIYDHRYDLVRLEYYARICLQPSQATEFLRSVKKQKKSLENRTFIQDLIKKYITIKINY
ncbi:hypothetical protein ACTFIW_000266 [Dictyostelium discoideum]